MQTFSAAWMRLTINETSKLVQNYLVNNDFYCYDF